MQGALDIHLAVAVGGVTPRAYTTTLDQLTRSLEELDRLAAPNLKDRVAWFVTDTRWDSNGPRIRLRPDIKKQFRTSDELMRPSRALVAGVRQLRSQPEIPADFSEGVVDRVRRVSALTMIDSSGLRNVDVSIVGEASKPAPLDVKVEQNAERAVAAKSLAYGSVIGRLDLISSRGRAPSIGLLPEHGSPITCVVSALDQDTYLRAFNQRVLVEGLVRRNGRGQAIRIDADSLTVLEPAPPTTARDLLGALTPNGQSIADFMKEQRGR